MRNIAVIFRSAALVLVFALTDMGPLAQPRERMTIQARVTGTGTQLGKAFKINIDIEKYSSLYELNTLIDASARSGQQGILETLEKMPSKGRLRTTWAVSKEIKYIFELPSEQGRHLQIIADRTIAFAESHSSSRSEEYRMAAVDLILTSDGRNSGVLFPSCKLTVNQEKHQIEVETFHDRWNLTNILVFSK